MTMTVVMNLKKCPRMDDFYKAKKIVITTLYIALFIYIFIFILCCEFKVSCKSLIMILVVYFFFCFKLSSIEQIGIRRVKLVDGKPSRNNKSKAILNRCLPVNVNIFHETGRLLSRTQ